MPVKYDIKISADTDNAVKVGSDNGLLVPSNLRSPPHAYVVDNSWGSGTGATYWHQAQSGKTLAQMTLALGTGYVFPLAFARKCTLTTSYFCSTNNAPSGAGSVYASFYTGSTATGYPGAKLVDLFRWDFTTALNTPCASTTVNASPTFQAGTLYWAVLWATTSAIEIYGLAGGFPAIHVGGGTPTIGYVQNISTFTAWLDKTAAWASLTAAPSALTIATDFTAVAGATGASINTPKVFWGVTNV